MYPRISSHFIYFSICVILLTGCQNKTLEEPGQSRPTSGILFTSIREDENWDIYLIQADGSGLTRLTENPSNVGIPYYFSTMTPVALGLLILLTLFPAFRWNEGVSRPYLLVLGGVTATITILTLFLLIIQNTCLIP